MSSGFASLHILSTGEILSLHGSWNQLQLLPAFHRYAETLVTPLPSESATSPAMDLETACHVSARILWTAALHSRYPQAHLLPDAYL